jgi:hypothetical protein
MIFVVPVVANVYIVPVESLTLLPFAIMLAKLPFWAQIKNLRTRCREPHKSTSSGRRNIIVSDLKRYDKGLPEYVK